MSVKIAIVGGGIAGASAALHLSSLGLNITLFEKEKSLVSGPPMCHLHAGGNLYREIDDLQCISLLKQSIELLRFYPFGIDFRPTLIATPKDDPQTPNSLLKRVELLKNEYAKLIQKDIKNRVLGEAEEYYKLYSYDDMLYFKEKSSSQNPQNFDEWIVTVAKNVDLDKLQYPLIMVQEYGLNMFRISASVSLCLAKNPSARVLTSTQLTDVKRGDNGFEITYKTAKKSTKESFDYLINAAGFKTGEIDDILGFKRERLVEFKAAYVTQWSSNNDVWPEVVFHGQRGTPQGMAQFTPYPDAYFQLHGMTEKITLFKNGLVRSSTKSAQPQLQKSFLEKIERGWHSSLVEERTAAAIEHIAQFIPSFKDATLASKPLYGAQQIPGVDKTLRASEVSFEAHNYARCEIVKASSILDMIDSIIREFIKLKFLDASSQGKRDLDSSNILTEKEVESLAEKLCLERDYPLSLARVIRSF